ncbi:MULTISPECIES: DUF3413 domain-containing protein [Alteromonadaceae]|uniref:DUF3413 domain-containing protein n=1 Tax=Alteromonadaceae TaxID=72275 RepID=UPI001C09991C|nr:MULTISPECIES: DUF3413 domain-containing protein [Aliiglaciecola]MBU2877342.1 DUF3413 domain-containing protein [Aliiglaciecola lipolytica]MDO6712990.1 DUF3413 domain-containing protein [Aliiglaciecola sp. 2_MG-2023]MDO6754029.1 DUF3413 domain-containing protein [Aliiglaciecola sp. 1_MG-2023]
MILSETPRRIMLTKLVAWGHWFTLSNIVVALVIAGIYVFASPLPDSLLGITFLLVNWVSHIGFLTFFAFVILVLPLIYAFPKSRLIRGAASTIAAIGLALLAFDALLYTKYGLHLNFGSADLIKSETQPVINAFGWQQWGFLLLLFVVWLSFQLILANALWKRIERLQKFRLGMPISSVFVTCFVCSHALHIWADANLYQPIVKQDNLFPLSYPATAKALMSKYGLLDIENYKQRKALQFDRSVHGINYPANPVYCSINTNKQFVLLIQTDDADLNLQNRALTAYNDHYDLSSNHHSSQFSSLFGLPEIYTSELTNKTPLMVELPQKLGLPVFLYSDLSLENSKLTELSTNFESFVAASISDKPKLAIGFVSNANIQQLIKSGVLNGNQVIISKLASNRDDIQQVPLYANFKLDKTLSSHLDFPATVLENLGCKALSDDYSIGQSMQAPRRNWLVGTKGSKVIVMQNSNRIEVLSNGSYKIFDRETGEESIETLNTGLLSQAIKHLMHFY